MTIKQKQETLNKHGFFITYSKFLGAWCMICVNHFLEDTTTRYIEAKTKREAINKFYSLAAHSFVLGGEL